jgi:hypothetical protein
MFHVPEKYRITTGVLSSQKENGNNGAFKITSFRLNSPLNVIASDGYGWEHVSVSLSHRCPKWEEMCLIKDIFWDDDDFVVQIHPPKDDYVNNHPYCLHLWRKAGTNDFCQRPPNSMVGITDKMLEQRKISMEPK